jgi:hypothetical protein
MAMKKLWLFVIVLCFSLTMTGYASESQAVDYSQSAHWLSLPKVADKAVDVFYLYPTAWHKVDEGEPNVCKIDNPIMLKQAKIILGQQATAFETVGNIYAPYYRQGDAAYILSLPYAERDKFVGGIPAGDATAAFDYFIKHYNNGRPFILAGHSQGSMILRIILADYMAKNPDVYKRMIAAYVIGYSVTEEYLAANPHLKFARGPDDTGVIISYNTQAPVISGTNGVVLPGAIAINPITWTRGETPASAEQNLGSILLTASGEVGAKNVMNIADARVSKARGVVICSTANVKIFAPGDALFGKGVFHGWDYPFYYNNIRENAANRARIFLSRK